MSRSFLPGFHFRPESEKLSREWCHEAIQYYYYNNHIKNLLEGKNVEEIEGYASGNYDLKPYKRMFRSLRNQAVAESNPNISKEEIIKLDTTGLQIDRVALIPPKLNSAIATQQKIPLEIIATCLDALAQKKKEEDLDFLRTKNQASEVLQPLYDSMNLGKVDMGATKHSSVPFTGMPMDLDIEDEEEFRLFSNMIYNLAPESAIETILQALSDTKKVIQYRGLETADQLKFGVSVNEGIADKNTDLPNLEYIHPGNISTDGSFLPDFSDNTIRIKYNRVTPMELFKYFPDEICDEDHLYKIVNHNGGKGDWENGYTVSNSMSRVEKGTFNTFKMTLLKVEVKSVDNVMVAKKKKSNYKYFTSDETKCTSRVWGQNTYIFYWLPNTRWFFGIDRLGFAYRSKGSEIISGFTTNIYKSQSRSAVEHCINENRKAQMADIKLQYEIIMSKPPGVVVDIKYIRNVIDRLSDEMSKYTMKELIDKATESNIHIIDTEGYENKQQAGQYLPVRDLPGGLKDSILGYYKVRFEAERNISYYLSVNEQLTGQSATPEGLVGLQKLLLSASINGLNYVTEAIQSQYQGLFNIWAYYVQQAIKKGGAGKKAIENIIGSRKIDILRGLNEVPLHQIGIFIRLGQREEERARNEKEIERLRQAGVLNAADIYEIANTVNPRDAFWLIAVKETRFQKKQDKARKEQLAAQQQMVETQGQNAVAQTQASGQNQLQVIQAEGAKEARLMTLGNQLGLSQKQLDAMIKRSLQSERISQQTDKAIKTIEANKNAKNQEGLV
jgi:hypothetical protein